MACTRGTGHRGSGCGVGMVAVSKRDIVVLATLRISVRANSYAEAIEWVEQCQGAPIDNDGMIVAVEDVRKLTREEVCY